MRKVISLLMSLLMCFSMSVTASAQTAPINTVLSYYKLNTTTRVIATESKTITSPVDAVSLKYIIARGEGSANLLVGCGSCYGVEVSGTWEP